MNSVSLIGRVARDVEVTSLATTGRSVLNNSLAVQSVHRSGDEGQHVSFISFVAWGKTADLIGKYVKKGDRIGLEGYLQTRSYTNKQGQTVYVTEVVVQEVFFLEPRRAESPQPNPFIETDQLFAPSPIE